MWHTIGGVVKCKVKESIVQVQWAGFFKLERMDSSSLLALSNLLKPPEEDKDSEDVRYYYRYVTFLNNNIAN